MIVIMTALQGLQVRVRWCVCVFVCLGGGGGGVGKQIYVENVEFL